MAEDSAEPIYDTIGRQYRRVRIPDPRIAALIDAAIGDARTVLNVGAGAGSYEPRDRSVWAVEPSRVMIEQRPAGAAPVIQACAEKLPFEDGRFDVATAFLTIHHWAEVEAGLAELRRVARRVVLLTWTGFANGFWLMDYFPEIERFDLPIFPTEPELERMLGGIQSTVVEIPHDCVDGFLCAHWRYPERYLDEQVRSGISTFQRIGSLDRGLDALRRDLDSGTWHERYGQVLERESMDYGYRIIESC